MQRHHILAVALIALASTTSIAGAQGRGRGRGRGEEEGRGRGRGDEVPQAEQQRRINEEQERRRDYQARLDAQIRAAQAEQARIAARHQAAQIAQQQRYLDALRRQQEQARVQRNIAQDAYVTTPMRYRYRVNGTAYTTNRYGADAMRAAVNNGYSEGYQQGQADRQDGLSSNYRRSFAYQDATYGYSGAYISQNNYTYYFRAGFQRGYQDGYAHANRYGNFTNGTGSILSNILNGILGLTSIP